ncbi:MAG: ATP-binding protein, partial [Helicobacteraceae bacterium]|nr:ATP-binding protein [Helicobacteraceae bacterium]
DLKTNKFVYAGAVEEISIQELAQTKEHYIGLAYDSEEGGAEKMHNQMQNIFLEQIERFNGILIATTNLLDNIDSAFSRRFDYKIKFEKPTEKERLEIWQKTLPKNAPIAKDLNLAAIAKYPLTGAQIALAIKNAVMNVAIQNAPLFTNAVFERAIKKELSGAFGEEKTLGFLS